MFRLSCLSVELLLVLACFFEGVVGDICCSEVFEFWSKLATEIFQEGNNIGPRVSQGRPQSVQGGTPRGSERQVAKQMHHP